MKLKNEINEANVNILILGLNSTFENFIRKSKKRKYSFIKLNRFFNLKNERLI